jgi:diketogulonate reductase-like aldo/keto reductase
VSGLTVPVLGMGAWHLGEDPRRRDEERRALQRGIDLGLTLIDTAEMYGDGASEELVGEAVSARRDEVILVSKVYPWNAARDRIRSSCEASLRRLDTDRLDLYLLHWPGRVPFEEVLEGMQSLREAGKILHFGVSNLDVDEMRELLELPGGDECAVDQVLYNLTRRAIEAQLMDVCLESGIGLMAYTPLESGTLAASEAVQTISARHGVSAAQVALAWTLRHEGVIAIPKAARVDHMEDNARALEVELTREDLDDLDHAFPPPRGPAPLEMI